LLTELVMVCNWNVHVHVGEGGAQGLGGQVSEINVALHGTPAQHVFDLRAPPTCYDVCAGIAPRDKIICKRGRIAESAKDIEANHASHGRSLFVKETDVQMQYTVKQAGRHDAEALWQMLYYAAWMELDGVTSYHAAKHDPYLREYVVDWGRADDVGVLADQAGTLLGAAWARVVPHPPGIANVPSGCLELAVAVHPQAQRSGVGSTLMACCCALADARGLRLALTVRKHNPVVHWYMRYGFVVVATSVNRVGSESLIMQRM
jgi:ribosomal protein S18 acetylase RimI-like enzyme